jgi:tetratricopeptide (TPR) repeat protein
LSSGILLARIDDAPKRAIRADYADAWRDYGDRVSAEYSFNFVPSRSYFAVLNGPDETPFVNYSIEIDAQNFSMETDEANTRFYTALDISVEARNKEGVVVLARDREDYLELEPGQFQDARASPFSYQADFPLLPGQYKVSVILRNRVLKQYTVAESDITVEPLWSGKPTLSDLILGYAVDELLGTSARENEFWTFQVGSARVHPAAGGVFSLGETVHVFLQVQGAPPDSQVHIALLNGEEVLQERTTTLSKYLGGPVIERFPLRGMVGGRYVFRVRLLDPLGAVAAERTAGCQISPRAAIPRPWVTRVSFNAATPGLLALARGDQFLAEKRLPQATAEFEKALAAGGAELPVARWRLALILIQTGNAARALELLTPIEQQFPNQVEVVAGLGYAYSLRNDCAKALGYLERAITLRPPDTILLNVLANCYERTGDNLKATETYQRSLALNPEQPRVKEHLASIQGNDP